MDSKQVDEAKIVKFFIKLSGLARKVTSKEIYEFLSCCVNKLEIVKPMDKKGKPSGDAFVKIDSEEELKLALSLNDTEMGNRKIEVCQITIKDFDEAEKGNMGVPETNKAYTSLGA